MIKVLRCRSQFNLVKIFADIRIRVREAVRKVDLVVIGFKSVSKSKCIVTFVWKSVARRLVSDVVLVVADIRTYSVPACVVLFG